MTPSTVNKFRISKKFGLIMTVASVLAMLMVSGTIIIYEQYSFKSRILSNINIQADIITQHLGVAIRFEDSNSAAESLKAFHTNTNIRVATVYTRTGTLFASYGDFESKHTYVNDGVEHATFYSDTLAVTTHINDANETLGALHLEHNIPELLERLSAYSPFLIVTIFALVLINLIVSFGTSIFIIEPMNRLITTAKAITRTNNYSLRTDLTNNDEIGELADTLNELLDVTEVSQNELIDINSELKDTNAEIEMQNFLVEASRREYQELVRSHELLLKSANEGIIRLDKNGLIIFCNPKAAEILEIDEIEILAMNIVSFFGGVKTHVQNSEAQWRESIFCKTLETGGQCSVEDETWHSHKGRRFHIGFNFSAILEDGNKNKLGVLMFENITTRKNAEAKLSELANYDNLTHLVNRRYFYELVELSINRSNRSSSPIALLFIDVDHFKLINDNFGHDIGDKVLTRVALVLKECVRIDDIVSRLSGDEFSILLFDIETASSAEHVAKKIIRKLTEPTLIDGYQIKVETSIGISVYPGNGESTDQLLKAADTAMYQVKKEGRHGIQFFEDALQQEVDNRNRILQALNKSENKNDFEILFQPKYCIHERKLIGAEALLRWKIQDENIPPDVFIPIAEESGHISDIGSWVMLNVCQQFAKWRRKYTVCDKMRVSVNVSPRQLFEGDFSEKVHEVLYFSRLPPECLEIEITETAAMEDPEAVIGELTKIRELGVKISIDDFGTGYSSLNYLKRLPIDILKIDKSFTMDIGKNENDEAIVRAVIAIAHSMKLEVIAEGVEELNQLIFLDQNLCDHVQGYYFSKPLTMDDFEKILGSDSCSIQYDLLDEARDHYFNTKTQN